MFSFYTKSEVSVPSANEVRLMRLLQAHVPPAAVLYCLSLWKEHSFSFKVTRSRSSCLGNYKYEGGNHTITVNNDLNRYNFLITYIHEVAHMKVQLTSGNRRRKRPLPHGEEWKCCFQEVFAPLLNEEVFPEDILIILSQHMVNPAASSTRDHRLMQVLRSYDEGNESALHLENIPDGETFLFKNRLFQKLEKRRTRALCLEVKTKRKYTIPLLAEIQKAG
jgi:SprT protein